MNVQELIKELSNMPQDADVWTIWDGEPRSSTDNVWLAIDGRVMLCDNDETVYTGSCRPAWAPTQKENPYWHPE